jgi:hypothetical protein
MRGISRDALTRSPGHPGELSFWEGRVSHAKKTASDRRKAGLPPKGVGG